VRNSVSFTETVYNRAAVDSQSRFISATVLALALLVRAPTANAAEIKIWTARALATVLAEVGPQFERATGHKLDVSSGLPTDFVRRADAGESFDVLISGSAPVDQWVRDGRLLAETRTDIARSGIGVAVRAGTRKPDVGSVDAFQRALIEARSIAYLRVGSGIYLDGLFDRLGIAEAVQSKATRPESDIVCELVAKGEIELGIVVITQILTTPGVELVGPLPPEIQSHVVFTGGVSAGSKAPEAARQLLEFLAGPAAKAVIRAQGMEPAL
jgi:molybdate transport system substrate-binding protein